MRVFIPKGSHDIISKEILNENCFAAYYGFSLMGWDNPNEERNKNIINQLILDLNKEMSKKSEW